MSDRLTISACFSVIAMASFALASPQLARSHATDGGWMGAAITAAAPTIDAFPGLPALRALTR